MGIDPGTTVTGYGIIAIENNKISHLIEMGYLKLDGFESHYLRLKRIFERVQSLINQHHPDELAIEAPFYDKNVQSMLKLGRAQGVAMAAALVQEIPITEYAPRKVKQSITGAGTASKEQVAAMLMRLLHLTELPAYLDATDGLAVAVCHYLQTSNPVLGGGGATNWKTFLTQNPNRIK